MTSDQDNFFFELKVPGRHAQFNPCPDRDHGFWHDVDLYGACAVCPEAHGLCGFVEPSGLP